MNFKHLIRSDDAPRVSRWITTQGGLQVWKSINASDPDTVWETPVVQSDGMPTVKPSWKAASQPETITDLAAIGVVVLKEYKRFRVGLRTSNNGLSVKLTDASNRRLNHALAAAGEYATYEFDYSTQEAVVYSADRVVSLPEWLKNS